MLKGHINNLTEIKMPDHYIWMTEEITNYIGWTYKKNTGVFAEAITQPCITMLTASCQSSGAK